MKLHLPAPLFRCVLAAISTVAAFTCNPTAEAADQHADVSLLTYTDFGQNMGRYAVGNTNALLKHLNAGGVTISYEGGQADYTLQHGMVDFSSVTDNGWAGAIGYNFVASATHVMTADPTFSANNIGASNAINYKGIEYSTGNEFLHKTGDDYKITRLSKIVTDVSTATVYSGATDSSLQGELIYRAGAGSMYKADHEGNRAELGSGYITGGIDTIDYVNTSLNTEGSFATQTNVQYGSEGIGESEPLPYMGRPGDSGSPNYVWNEQTQQYEYLNAASSIGTTMTQNRGNCDWTQEVMNSYNKEATIGSDNTIFLGAITTAGETITEGDVSTTLYSGNVTNASGEVLATYNGVQSGINTWKKLNFLKDEANWYAYDNGYLNASSNKEGTGVAAVDMIYADLFHNDNLVIRNSSSDTQTINLNATVDLGIGYVQFALGEGQTSANYLVQSADGGDYLLNAAGFVVDEGVSVHMTLTNPADYIREWRKVGAGDLYIEGEGNNDIFLNVGGSGTTYLQRTDEFGFNAGYAAYNVLVNNGATVVINDAEQIARDLTFGNGGGVLDLNGAKLTNWNNDNSADAAGFTIHALDEQAIITNSKAGDPIKGGGSELWWTQGGEQTWLGSFADTTQGTLKFHYDGGEGSRLTMHSIHTNLKNNSAGGSGMEVWSGTLALAGSNTVHGTGSLNGIDLTRYENADDWHYADAASDVTVNSGGTFELGSHARLTGNVTVNAGGTFVMREGVKHQMEYIEGGQKLENTNDIREFFGLKGNVNLSASTATMQVQFSEGTDSTLEYGGRIYGSGSLSVEAGTDGGMLRLTGRNNLHTGSKTIISGGVYANSDEALGNTTSNKWLIGERGWLAADSFTSADTITEHIDANSTGVLALTTDIVDEISLSGHQGLIIGAMEGLEVEYGTADQSLTAIDGRWTLGGGGGTLIVNFLLTGDHELVLGNEYGKGSVHLTNTGNNIGKITFAGGVTLSYEEGALGDVGVDLGYGSNLDMLNASHLTLISHGAEGAMLVDNFATTDMDLSEHQGLALASKGDSTYSGNITLAEGAAYRFGGSTGTFTVATTLEAGHDLVIDGQGWSGGSVTLENASAVDGDVIVRGYDATRSTQAVGTATLQLTENNGLANAASVTVDNGGSIELGGTSQTFNNLTLGSGGTLQDSSADSSGTLELTGEAVLNGSLSVANVIKTGEGNVTLGGTNMATRFEVQGTGDNVVTLTSATATHSQGTLAVSNATLDLNRKTSTNSGTIELGEGAHLVNMGVMHTLHVTGNSTGNYRSANGTVNPAGKTISITTLRVDEGGSFTLEAAPETQSAASIGTLMGAGDVAINMQRSYSTAYGNAYAVSLSGNNQTFSGHLSISANHSSQKSGVTFGSYASFGSGTVTLNGVQFSVSNVNAANTAISATLDVGSNGATLNTANMHFSGLSGSGQLEGSNMNFHGNLTGFSGRIWARSDYASFGGAGVNYHSTTGNSAAGAISLFTDGATLYSSSANKGTFRFQYEDDVILNALVQGGNGVEQKGTGRLVINQANTATGTLTINEGGTVELAEGGSWAGALAGSGTLVNSNSAATIKDASAFTGSLSLAEGSSLSFSAGSYSLNAGESLGVFAVDAEATGATFNFSSLTLNGGSLSFSAGALVNDSQAALITSGSISVGSSLSGQTIILSDTSALSTGSYLLASGDWSSLSGTSFTVSGIEDYLTSSVTASASGLMLTLTQTEGIHVWNGTDGQSSWTPDTFGPDAAGSGNAYFTDSAASKEVSISGSVSANALVFNTTEDYALTPEAGSTLSASSLELKDSGKVTLGAGVTISGATTLTEGSEVVVKDFNTLSGAVSGHGTVTIDAGAASGNLAGTMSGLDTLKIVSGQYNAKGTAVQADHVVVEGGQFYIWSTGNYDYDLTLSGNGWTDKPSDTYADAALRSGADRANISGTVTLASDVTVAVDKGNTGLVFIGKVEGQGHTLTKTGSMRLWLGTSSADMVSDLSLIVKEGIVRLGGAGAQHIPTGIKAATVKQGATLEFYGASGSVLATEFALEGHSTLDLTSGNNAHGLNYEFTGNLALTTASDGSRQVKITSSYGRNLTLSGLVSGTGGLQLTGNHSSALSLTLANTNNSFDGGITVAANRTNVTINLAAAGSAGTGAIELGNDSALLNVAGDAEGYGQMANTISGTGKLHVTTGGLELSGQNSYAGGTTVGNGASLKLTHASAAGTGAIALSDATSELVYAGSETAQFSTLANAVSGAGKLQVASGKVALSTSSSVAAATVQQGAALRLAGEASLTVADAVTLSNRQTAAAARNRAAQVEGTLENVAITDSGMTAADAAAQGVVSGAAVAVSASAFSMSDLALVNAEVTLLGGSLSLNDVVLASGSTVAATGEAASTIDMANVTFVLDDSMSYELQEAATLLGAGYTGTVRVYDISNFSNVTLAGGMMMDVSALQPQTVSALTEGSGYDYLAFNFSGSTLADDFMLSSNASEDAGMKLGASTYVFRAESSDAVPEPSSSALALLGLGALALRRRRK